MHVACVNQDPGVGPTRSKGAAVHLAAMRRSFAQLGAEVSAFDEPDAAALAQALDAAPPIDLVYERYALGKGAAAAFCQRRQLPHVLEVNAPLAEEAARFRDQPPDPEAERNDRNVFSSASRVLAVSSAVADYAIGRGAHPERVEVVANGVDPSAFHPARRAEPAPELAVPEGRFVLGFHGRLRPWHGFERVAEIAGQLLQRGIDVHLVTVGTGDFAAATEPHLAPERASHVGWQPHDQVGRFVARFDVLPLPYPADAPCYFSPLKLAEAMASGVVPVVPALGDLPRAVTDGRTGRVLERADTESFVAAIEELALHPPLRAALAQEAALAAAQHTWRGIAEDVLRHARGVRA